MKLLKLSSLNNKQTKHGAEEPGLLLHSIMIIILYLPPSLLCSFYLGTMKTDQLASYIKKTYQSMVILLAMGIGAIAQCLCLCLIQFWVC